MVGTNEASASEVAACDARRRPPPPAGSPGAPAASDRPNWRRAKTTWLRMHNPSPTHPGPRPFVDPSFDNGQLAYGIGNHQGQKPCKFFVPERPETRLLRPDLPRFYPASPARTQSFDVTDLGHSTVSRPATHPLAVASWPLTLLFPAGESLISYLSSF